MVTITVRPLMRYSPISNLWEKRPERSFPTSLTPFWLATLLALASSKEGLAEIFILNVLAMPASAHLSPFCYPPFPTNEKPASLFLRGSRLRYWLSPSLKRP